MYAPYQSLVAQKDKIYQDAIESWTDTSDIISKRVYLIAANMFRHALKMPVTTTTRSVIIEDEIGPTNFIVTGDIDARWSIWVYQ